MKPYYLILAIMLICRFTYAGTGLHSDTTRKAPVVKELKTAKDTFTIDDHVPEFPGGIPALGDYIRRGLQYPDVARLIGIDGRVIVTFMVDTTGHVINVTPVNCIGAGCESEAARVLENSPQWKPGIKNGRLVSVKYAVPITFKIEEDKVLFKDLQKSDYGFVFEIKGKRYTMSEARDLLGNSFNSEEVQIAEPFYNDGNNHKFNISDKKGVYLIRMKEK